MEKQLCDLTLQELWRKFPILLVPHQDIWKTWFVQEKERLLAGLPEDSIRWICHVGSTSVDSIKAKPIIDILVEASPDCPLQPVKEAIERLSYLCMSDDGGRISFNRGYTMQGYAERVFHLHLRRTDDHDELYFRDYLTENPEVAREYEQLKLSLWKEYEFNRDAYTGSKHDFVKRYTEKAKERYAGRYEIHVQ